MKDITKFIKEGWRSLDKEAPADVQKFLGLKYADGHGGGDNEEKLTFTGGGSSGGYMERGKIEGQDKVFAVQSMYTDDITDDNATIWVCTASRSMSKKLTIVAVYTTSKEEAQKELKEKRKGWEWKANVEKIVLCKDTDDVVTNIRNDYGKIKTYRNIGHGEEKDGIMYSYALK